MTEKTGFKYTVKFSQSLTTGTIGFEGSYNFDDPKEFENPKNKQYLVGLLEAIEETFEKKGFKIASITPTNMEKNIPVKSGRQEAKELEA